jgi:NAD(P)-dependent dehydrogenase (short-subunit alcohol dehydrogenase family)
VAVDGEVRPCDRWGAGLGFATAKAFKAEGAKVAVTDRLEAEGARLPES